MGGFLFVFLCVRSCICLFVYCLFVRYLLQTLEPTGFKATFSEDRSKNPVLKVGFFFWVLFFFLASLGISILCMGNHQAAL